MIITQISPFSSIIYCKLSIVFSLFFSPNFIKIQPIFTIKMFYIIFNIKVTCSFSITSINWIIFAICINVITNSRTRRTNKSSIISIYNSTCLRIVVAGLEIVKSCVGIIYITTITELVYYPLF